MNALQVVKPRHFTEVQIEIPDLKTSNPNHILVKPIWVSMCGSDIPYFSGNKRHKSYPLLVGAPIHECVGKVVESTSDLFQPGDRVISIPESDQGLAEFFIAQASKSTLLPAELEDHGTSCLIQPLATVINALDRLGQVEGKSVAVMGLGSMGLLFCWLLKRRGAVRIVGIDPLKERCRFAERFGATEVIPARGLEVLHDVRQNPNKWDAPDICIEAVGHQMDTLNDCLSLVKQQGIVLAFGVPDQPIYAVEYETLFRKNAHLMACVTTDWGKYLAKSRDIYLTGRNELEPLVTHRLLIRDAEKAFTMYEQHQDGVIKVLMEMSEM